MKILAIGDFHGNFPVTKKFLKKNNIELLISQGDFPSSEKIRDIIFKNWKEYRQGKSLEQIIGKNKWEKILQDDIKSQTKVLRKLDSLNIPVFIVFGNAEHRDEIRNYLKKSKNIKYIGSKKVKFGGFYFVGIDSPSNEMPHQMEAMENRIRELLEGVEPVVLLTHEPPYGTVFDIVRNKDSPKNGEHVGSELVKQILREYKPLVNVFGHMHEHFGKQKIGKTILIGAGYGHDGYVAIIILNRSVQVKLIKL